MRDVRLIDTNILLRHLLGDIPDHSRQASSLFTKVMRGESRIYAPSTVFFEVSYVMTRHKGVPAAALAKALQAILQFPGFETDHPGTLNEALSFWAQQGPLSFADCFHLALTKELGMTQIFTFDKKMDRYPGVERVEP